MFGTSAFGHAVFLIVQLVTLLILYTGGNTSFNGFPFLASFVAEDRFLPAKLTKRGHRLVFSNGIIVLAVVSIALLLVTRAQVELAGGGLRHRGVHRVHHGRGREWSSTTGSTRDQAGGTAWPSTAAPQPYRSPW